MKGCSYRLQQQGDGQDLHGTLQVEWQTVATLRCTCGSARQSTRGKPWADAAGHFTFSPRWEAFRLSQNHGVGMVVQGTRDWRDYAVSSSITPHLARSFGLLARVQGLKRWYGLLFDRTGGSGTGSGDEVKLIRMSNENG